MRLIIVNYQAQFSLAAQCEHGYSTIGTKSIKGLVRVATSDYNIVTYCDIGGPISTFIGDLNYLRTQD